MIQERDARIRIRGSFARARTIAVSILLLGLGLQVLPAEARMLGGSQEPGLRLLRSDASGLWIELTSPEPRLVPVRQGRAEALRPELPGSARGAPPGAPDLPTRSLLVGIPPGGEPRLELETPDSIRWRPAGPIAVVPSGEAIGLEAASEVSDASPTAPALAWPDAPAELVAVGWLRDQRVARIELRPLRYDPDRGELTLHRRLRLRLRFEPSGASAAAEAATALAPDRTAARPRPSDPSFDALLDRFLINAEAARAWRGAGGALPAGLGQPEPPPGSLLANIGVEAEGIHALSGFDLTWAGVSLEGIDARALRLYEQGVEVAIQIEGEEDGRLDLTDRLSFYGRPSSSRESRQRVYQLVAGAGPGLRMARRAVDPAGAGRAPALAYTATRQVDLDAVYVSELPRFERGLPAPPGEPIDRWYSKRISDAVPLATSLADLRAAPGDWQGRMRVSVVGRSSFETLSPDHELRLRVGGETIGLARWDGNRRVERFEQSVPAALLQAPTVELRFEASGGTGAAYDQFYVDGFELDYRRLLRAEGGWLRFTADPGAGAFDVDGFADATLEAYDLSQPQRPVRLDGLAVSGGAGDHRARFDDAVTGASYGLVDATGLREPASIEARQEAPPLSAPPLGADYLILAHPRFAAAMQPLLAARGATMRAELIDLQQVYDAFSGGQTSSRAIREMIAWAYHRWPGTPLRQVLLVGDGSYDMLGRLPGGNPSYLPPYLLLADPWLGEVPSDNAYAAVNGEDYFPDLYLGRLPVSTTAETAELVQRILAYEQSPPAGDWRSRMLLVADDPDVADFPGLSDAIIEEQVPAAFQTQRVYLGRTHGSASQARAAIVAALGQGQLLTQYTGHGQSRAWAAEGLLRASDLAGLTNGERRTVVLDWTCLTGRFHEPSGRSMAESALLAPGGGAVAYVAPTGFGVATGHDFMNRAFLDALFRDGTTEVGALLMAAKLNLFGQTGAYHDLLETYMLFGDPATSIQLPEGYVPTGPSSTPTVLPRPSATPTATATATASPTATATASPTASPTATATASPTVTPTATAMTAPTVSPTATPMNTGTVGPSATAPGATAETPEATWTPSPVATPTPSSTSGLVASATTTPTATATPSVTPPPTATPTEATPAGPTASPSATHGATSIPTASATIGVGPSSTPATSEAPSATPVSTGVPTATTATATAMATPVLAPTGSATPDATRSATVVSPTSSAATAVASSTGTAASATAQPTSTDPSPSETPGAGTEETPTPPGSGATASPASTRSATAPPEPTVGMGATATIEPGASPAPTASPEPAVTPGPTPSPAPGAEPTATSAAGAPATQGPGLDPVWRLHLPILMRAPSGASAGARIGTLSVIDPHPSSVIR